MAISTVGKPGRSGAGRTRPDHVRRSQRGFSYVMVLAAVVIVGIAVEVAQVTTWRVLQVDREAELLFRGDAYRRAIRSYYEAGKPVKSFPRALEDLVKDPRFPNRRHLRTLYPDPMAKDKKGEWTLIRALDGGIAGVASRSADEPMRQANFPKDFEKFAGAQTYSEWLFEYRPPPVVVPPKPPGPLRPGAPSILKTF